MLKNFSSCHSSSLFGEHSYSLTTYRNSLIGSVSHTLEQYNPHRVLQSITGGKKLLCLDSRNLPPDWREMNLNKFFETPAGNVGGADV